VDQELFHKGYIAGWRSIRGDDGPVVVPTSPVRVGPATYMVGFARGARDARVIPADREIEDLQGSTLDGMWGKC
jgi:hypothetical protein